MAEKERQFLTVDEALDAVRIAFAQYPSQLNLLSVIWPMIFGDGSYVLFDVRRRLIWAKRPGKAKPVPSTEDKLKQHILDQLRRHPPSLNALSRICSLIFGVSAASGTGPGPNASPGIWIEIDMAGFVCVRCGHCCRTLNYHDGCSVSDYERWQDLGRIDILDWVGTIRKQGRITACRIWMLPGTNQFADSCPWLKRLPDGKTYACIIHDVRPTICRQYPGSRKHARMTGCKGV
jgi:Fe-S-cluster containining protein